MSTHGGRSGPRARTRRSDGTPKSKKTKAPVVGAVLNRIADYAPGHHPVHVYLSGLSPSSARVTGVALESIADILSDGRRSAEDLAWHLIRAQHVATLRGRLQYCQFALLAIGSRV